MVEKLLGSQRRQIQICHPQPTHEPQVYLQQQSQRSQCSCSCPESTKCSQARAWLGNRILWKNSELTLLSPCWRRKNGCSLIYGFQIQLQSVFLAELSYTQSSANKGVQEQDSRLPEQKRVKVGDQSGSSETSLKIYFLIVNPQVSVAFTKKEALGHIWLDSGAFNDKFHRWFPSFNDVRVL